MRPERAAIVLRRGSPSARGQRMIVTLRGGSGRRIGAPAARLPPVGQRGGRSRMEMASGNEQSAAVGPLAPRPPAEWFTANRVKGHTRLRLEGWGDEPEFAQAAAGFKALGARVFTRHVKSGDEAPWPPAVWK